MVGGIVETVDPEELVVRVSWQLVDRDASEVAADLMNEVKGRAEAERQRYLTPGQGKTLEYEQKVRELDRWAAAAPEDRTPENFPMLEATRAGRGLDQLSHARDLIAWAYQGWIVIGCAILKIEDGACAAIEAAATAADKGAIHQAVAWPAPPA
jgi:hypothetical protein